MSAPAVDTPATTPAAATATTTTPAPAASSASSEMAKYGTHEATCDGCNIRPIVGFRYKCTKCKDHDICETCYNKFQGGVLPHVNKLNPLSRDVAAHAFNTYVDGKSFVGIAGAAKAQPKVGGKKAKPNDPCPCGKDAKFKKCCGKP